MAKLIEEGQQRTVTRTITADVVVFGSGDTIAECLRTLGKTFIGTTLGDVVVARGEGGSFNVMLVWEYQPEQEMEARDDAQD